MPASSRKQGDGMLAIDTNVILRIVTNDHPDQAEKARALLAAEKVFISTTVLLETEWVLRSVYGYNPAQVIAALSAFVGLPQVTLEDGPLIVTALDWLREGMDFADALHLGRAQECLAFVSFDRQMAKVARRVSAINVRVP